MGSIYCCDLLENLYLCGSNNNSAEMLVLSATIVICLKICTFVVATTTGEGAMLWIGGCDLLENLYLCGSNNNYISLLHALYVL